MLDCDKVESVAKSKGLSIVFNYNLDNANVGKKVSVPYNNLAYGKNHWWNGEIFIVYKNYAPNSAELKRIAKKLELDKKDTDDLLSKSYQLVGYCYMDYYEEDSDEPFTEYIGWDLLYNDGNKSDLIERDDRSSENSGTNITDLAVKDLETTDTNKIMVWLLDWYYTIKM